MIVKAAYMMAFAEEQARAYPIVDAFTSTWDLDRPKLEAAALVLACPLKKSPPNWQHGRVLYAAAKRYLANFQAHAFVNILDIGTAKGFSALCLLWAKLDSKPHGRITSVDVIDPDARVARKTIAEVDGLLTLYETLAPWPEAVEIAFRQSTGIDWLEAHPERINIAFVDGAHTGAIVQREGELLAGRQEDGDLAIFDDVQRTDIFAALKDLPYQFDYLEVLPTRKYAIGVRR